MLQYLILVGDSLYFRERRLIMRHNWLGGRLHWFNKEDVITIKRRLLLSGQSCHRTFLRCTIHQWNLKTRRICDLWCVEMYGTSRFNVARLFWLPERLKHLVIGGALILKETLLVFVIRHYFQIPVRQNRCWIAHFQPILLHLFDVGSESTAAAMAPQIWLDTFIEILLNAAFFCDLANGI